MNIVMGQINTWVGDIEGNTQMVIEHAKHVALMEEPTVLVFPELTLTGYPPEDLLLRPSLSNSIDSALHSLCHLLPSHVWTIVGYPRNVHDSRFNAAGIIHEGKIVGEYFKRCLPNYQVFDEKRYFSPGTEPLVCSIEGVQMGVTICEDIWSPEPASDCRRKGAEILINLNASPFHRGKAKQRWSLLRKRALENNFPIVYVNQTGGQDELVFDGGSFAINPDGERPVSARFFQEQLEVIELIRGIGGLQFISKPMPPDCSDIELTWQALILGVRDYVNKNGFPSVVLGLSGGIDSAVTMAIAVAALGPEKVQAVMMPYHHTAKISVEDAAQQAKNLKVQFSIIPIEPMYDAFLEALADEFHGQDLDITEQNLQARCRGVVLMSISNKKGSLVLTTGNKSELAVGYSTLYGDMAGGFDVLKDCPKQLVYELARFCNLSGPCIPERVIERPPSAELAPDQVDENHLPPYSILDQILEKYIECDHSADQIVAAGFSEEDVRLVTKLVDLSEYKRRQAPVGIRISQRGFGRDRRYPISWAWRKS